MKLESYSNMGTVEYISYCFAIAGIAFVFTLWAPTKVDIAQPIIMECPSLVIRHSVQSNLKTGVSVVDECATNLNVIPPKG